jgi:hypothetical protein
MASVKRVTDEPASRLTGSGANLLRFKTRKVVVTTVEKFSPIQQIILLPIYCNTDNTSGQSKCWYYKKLYIPRPLIERNRKRLKLTKPCAGDRHASRQQKFVAGIKCQSDD